MKIEVDLLKIHDSPAMGRVAAVALLSALPEDEARLAMQQWAACREAAAAADARAVQQQEVAAEFSQEKVAAQPLDLPTFDDEQLLDSPKPLPDDWKPQPRTPEAGKADNQLSASPHAGTALADALSAKTANALKRAGFHVLGDLTACSGAQLLATVDRFGKGGLAEVEAAMAWAKLGLVELAAGEPVDLRVGPPTPRPAPVVVVDIADTLDFGAPASVEETKPNGSEGLSLRDLCKRAEHAVGRQAVMDMLAKHGVIKLAEVGDKEASVRAAVVGLLA